MNKNTAKRDNVRAEAIKIVAGKFNKTTRYVSMCVSVLTYDYGEADNIRKAFTKTYEKLKQVLS